MPRVRVHQHVNPLAPYYRQSVEAIDFKQVFANPELPLHLDIGCARGRFLLKMAQINPGQNFLGVEIREPLVDEANRIKDEYGLSNLFYKFCNATIYLDKVLSAMPAGVLQTVTIQFPDPWYKKKHAKRRMVKPEMVAEIAKLLNANRKVFVQTDVDFLADEMFVMFDETKMFKKTLLEENPFPIKTEREMAVEEKSLPVYRTLFEKIR
jgi:tRNA (guanine-N7-)-methyltransferase